MSPDYVEKMVKEYVPPQDFFNVETFTMDPNGSELIAIVIESHKGEKSEIIIFQEDSNGIMKSLIPVSENLKQMIRNRDYFFDIPYFINHYSINLKLVSKLGIDIIYNVYYSVVFDHRIDPNRDIIEIFISYDPIQEPIERRSFKSNALYQYQMERISTPRVNFDQPIFVPLTGQDIERKKDEYLRIMKIREKRASITPPSTVSSKPQTILEKFKQKFGNFTDEIIGDKPNDMSMEQYWEELTAFPLNKESANIATLKGYLGFMKWLDSQNILPGKETALILAAREGHLHILRWIEQKFGKITDKYTASDMVRWAVINEDMDLLKWLFVQGFYPDPREAKYQDKDNLIKWMGSRGIPYY